MSLLLILSHCVKVMGIYVKFYHDHSTNMVMSRDPAANFEKFISRLILFEILEQVTKFGGNWLKNKNLLAKNKTRGEKHLPKCL